MLRLLVVLAPNPPASWLTTLVTLLDYFLCKHRVTNHKIALLVRDCASAANKNNEERRVLRVHSTICSELNENHDFQRFAIKCHGPMCLVPPHANLQSPSFKRSMASDGISCPFSPGFQSKGCWIVSQGGVKQKWKVHERSKLLAITCILQLEEWILLGSFLSKLFSSACPKKISNQLAKKSMPILLYLIL